MALDSGEGFIRISGEVGTGKTMLCRTLLKGLRADEQAVYIPNPHLMPTMLRVAVARELGVPADSRLDQDLLLARIQERLIELAGQGKRVIVCLDEAQAMPDETLEALRLLTNLETERSKLLQVVLFGQPELEAKLAKPELRQVRQRIAWSYRLGPLTRDEVADYVAHRVRTAGCRGGAEHTLFSASALGGLDAASGGIPRLINVIGHKALLVAYGRGGAQVSAADVRAAAEDTDSAEPAARSRGRWLYAAAVLALVVGLVALWGGRP
ncbi:MAG: AAA family ATPase [Halofilum sp. (in: g-proteobacteria)]